MADQFDNISDRHRAFIEDQKMFFVGTAAPTGKVNISPKGMNALGVRQIYDMQVDLLQTSCGYAVPFFDFQRQRDVLQKWTEDKGTDGLGPFWQEKNLTKLDGAPTGIFGDDT